MPKPGQPEKQFNIKVRGEYEIGIVEATYAYCRENQINISDFVVDALSKALDSKLLPLDDTRSLRVEVEELRARLELFEESRNNSQLEEQLNKLSDELPRLVQDIWTLKEAMQGSGEPLLERVEKLEALIYELRTDMEKLKKSEVRSEDDSTTPTDSPKLKIEDDSTTPDDSPQFKCPNCNAVGIIGQKFIPSGSADSKKRHICLSCGKKTQRKLKEVK